MENYIALNIKHLCDKNFLSQKQFGELFDIKQATVNTYISGRSNPNVETIQKICSYFEITIDDFINLDLSATAKGYTPNRAVATTKEPAATYNDSSTVISALKETIEAQRDTIEAQKQTIQAYKVEINTLRDKLDHAS